MDIDKEQAAFETWWDEKYTSHKLNRKQTMGGDITRDYRDPRVQYAFEAWLERARQNNDKLSDIITRAKISLIDTGTCMDELDELDEAKHTVKYYEKR